MFEIFMVAVVVLLLMIIWQLDQIRKEIHGLALLQVKWIFDAAKGGSVESSGCRTALDATTLIADARACAPHTARLRTRPLKELRSYRTGAGRWEASGLCGRRYEAFDRAKGARVRARDHVGRDQAARQRTPAAVLVHDHLQLLHPRSAGLASSGGGAKVKATAMAGVFCLDSLWVKLQN
jgi:hypothetical protein